MKLCLQTGVSLDGLDSEPDEKPLPPETEVMEESMVTIAKNLALTINEEISDPAERLKWFTAFSEAVADLEGRIVCPEDV